MAKFYKSPFGTKINIEGLTPEQVDKVKALADKKYGSKAAALASQWQKKAAKTPAVPGAPDVTEPTNTTGVNMDTGQLDPTVIMENAPKIPGAEDLQGAVTAAQDANYSYITKDYAAQKQQEMNAAKQELANRGIPLDPSPDSLYGRTLQQIDKKYQALDDQAKNQAISQGNETLSTQVGVAKTANDAFLNAILGMSEQDLKKYGLDLDYKAKIKAIQASKAKGGGGGGGGDVGISFGGTAPGFNVSG